jgi:hypothetical protein
VNGDSTQRFDPWISPFDRVQFRAVCRNYIEETFSRYLKPGQRWGFKEIRYYSPVTIRFLADLFPSGRFVVLHRNLTELVVSNVMAPWSLGAIEADVSLDDLVYDCAYALTVIEQGLEEVATIFPVRCISINYEAIADEVDNLFAFLDLDKTREIEEKIRFTLGIRAGETPKDGRFDRKTLTKLAKKLLPKACQTIQENGVDLARLKRLCDGHYSFVVGDQHLVNSPLSSLF